MAEQSIDDAMTAAKLSDTMGAALVAALDRKAESGTYVMRTTTPRRTVEALTRRGLADGLALTVKGVRVAHKLAPAKEFAMVVDAPHTLYLDSEEGRKLVGSNLTPERVQWNADNARNKRLDWEQLPDGTVRIETRHYVPQVVPGCTNVECDSVATVEGLYYGSWSPVCHFHSYAIPTRPLGEAQQAPEVPAVVEEQQAAHRATGLTVIGSGPGGAFTTFADSAETVDRWLAEGFMHKHTDRQIPKHRDVCVCPPAAAAPVVASGCGGCGAAAGEPCKDPLLDLLAPVSAPVSAEEGDPQARECEECGAAPGEPCSPRFTCGAQVAQDAEEQRERAGVRGVVPDVRGGVGVPVVWSPRGVGDGSPWVVECDQVLGDRYADSEVTPEAAHNGTQGGPGAVAAPEVPTGAQRGVSGPVGDVERVAFAYEGRSMAGNVLRRYTANGNERVTVATGDGSVYALRADSVSAPVDVATVPRAARAYMVRAGLIGG